VQPAGFGASAYAAPQVVDGTGGSEIGLPSRSSAARWQAALGDQAPSLDPQGDKSTPLDASIQARVDETSV
jgi:hypothetical protein